MCIRVCWHVKHFASVYICICIPVETPGGPRCNELDFCPHSEISSSHLSDPPFIFCTALYAIPSSIWNHEGIGVCFQNSVPSPLDVDPNQWCIWLYHGCTAAVLIGHSRVPTGNHKVGPQIKLILLFTIYNSIAISMTTKRQKDRKTEKKQRGRETEDSEGFQANSNGLIWTEMNN